MKSPIFLLFLLLSMCLFPACDQDGCDDLNCQNGGVCVDGSCDCPEGVLGKECEIVLDPCDVKACVAGQTDTCAVGASGARCVCSFGFEGEQCEDSWADKFTGDFIVSENCGSNRSFDVQVVTGPRFNQITIANFNNKVIPDSQTAKVVVDVVSPNALAIPRQAMYFGFVEGSGSFNGVTGRGFSLNYTITNYKENNGQIDTLVLDCFGIFE
ncbi:MAG: hypothetical protein AAGI38_10720 [Bacteroidota bacterium]